MNFNPRAPCGARQEKYYKRPDGLFISIHAPRAGRDSPRSAWPWSCRNFNPRAPCGARPGVAPPPGPPWYFNPRAPCGARPAGSFLIPSRSRFQSTRPVRGATTASISSAVIHRISIHAPRAGRDLRDLCLAGAIMISIHAPRAGRDVEVAFVMLLLLISIHAPRAGRDVTATYSNGAKLEFQSTRPVRGATFI